MIPNELAKELHQISETMVRDAGEYLKQTGQTINWTTKLLEKADAFRHAGAKPIFLANKDGTKFAISSEETFQKKLH